MTAGAPAVALRFAPGGALRFAPDGALRFAPDGALRFAPAVALRFVERLKTPAASVSRIALHETRQSHEIQGGLTRSTSSFQGRQGRRRVQS